MLSEDRIRIRHMLDAAREAITFAAGRHRSAAGFRSDASAFPNLLPLLESLIR
jgi:hypothetical protein